VILDPIAMNQWFVNLEGVRLIKIDDEATPPDVHIELQRSVVGCPSCGVVARVKDRHSVRMIDLSMAGRKIALVWNKRRFVCLELDCPQGSWTESDARIGHRRLKLTDRAGRWATFQVGHHGRSVDEVASDLGCEWHTVNDAVLAYGEALIDHPDRFADVASLGLDEHLMVREGRWRHKNFVTAIVDVDRGQLLDIVPDRKGHEPKAWLRAKGPTWLCGVTAGTIDLSATYKSVFDEVLPQATLVADPFHLIKLANAKVDECRRRVQNETLGHRGRQSDPLYRIRRLLLLSKKRLDELGREKIMGYLAAGDPRGELQMTWHAAQSIPELYEVDDYELAEEFIDELIRDMAEPTFSVEVHSLGKTLKRWRSEIIAWHKRRITNGPTESMNNLAKRVKRVAFGFRSFRNYRVRALLYAGKPNWDLLATITPR
jgi:transposase